MRIAVTFYCTALTRATLHTEPSWLERWLLGREESDDIIIALPSLTGERLLWVRESTGNPVTSRRINAAIDRAWAAAEAALRVHASLT